MFIRDKKARRDAVSTDEFKGDLWAATRSYVRYYCKWHKVHASDSLVERMTSHLIMHAMKNTRELYLDAELWSREP